MNTKKILITDAIEQSCIDILSRAGFVVDAKFGIKKDEILKIIGEYDGLVVRSGTTVTKEIISASNKMKVIGRAGVGVDNIDVEAATQKGIIVMNAPSGNTISTAEHTLSLLLSLTRLIPQANKSLQDGKWERKKFLGSELLHKTIGVVGLGRIGREVVIRCQAFGMHIIGYDPVMNIEVAKKIGIELVSIDEIFSRSDFITFHVPISDATKNLICEESIKKCKTGVRIINCARGGIVNEKALFDGLESNKIGGAALDVFETEPPENNPLINHPKVVATPHLGASTEEAQEKVAILIAEQMVDALENNSVRGAVNADALQCGITKEIKPFLLLAQKIGSLHSQILNGVIKEVKIQINGEILHNFNSLLTADVLKGILSNLMSDTINYVNAKFIAEAHGLKIITETDKANEIYNNLISVILTTDKETKIISGTVFGNENLRIVEMDNFLVEFNPEGEILIYKNIDKPGMLAKVGGVLASNQINIAGLSLGRIGIGKTALTIVNVDSPIPKNVISEIQTIDGISETRTVKI